MPGIGCWLPLLVDRVPMESGTEIVVKFVFAKSMVVPIKVLSIPPLELQMAV